MPTNDEIITDINGYMKKYGGRNIDWYVGITSDPKDRLFNGHSVDKDQDPWIHRQATSSANARAIEQAYLDTGHDGGSGGGDDTTVHVYAYKKSSRTDP